MKFQVFKDGKAVEDFSLSAAYMFGADTIAVRSTDNIRFKNGIIECKKKSSESTGLALLWPVAGFGRILLPTTRLPERKKPYNLNVELARANLMQITLKREDWSLFEETNGLAKMAHQAGELFIEALGNIADPAKASKLADESLRKALVFSEKLASRHGEVFLEARCKNKGVGRHSLGCTIDPKQIGDEKYCGRLLDLFGFVTIPINWAQIETKRGEYDFSAIDRCIDFFAGKRLAVCAGPVICFSKEYLPKWLLDGKFEFEKIREIVYGFASSCLCRNYVSLFWVIRIGSNIHRLKINGIVTLCKSI